jgi:hypothetical protein
VLNDYQGHPVYEHYRKVKIWRTSVNADSDEVLLRSTEEKSRAIKKAILPGNSPLEKDRPPVTLIDKSFTSRCLTMALTASFSRSAVALPQSINRAETSWCRSGAASANAQVAGRTPELCAVRLLQLRWKRASG